MDPDSKRLRVSVTDGKGRPIRDGGLGRWLELVAPARARGDLAVALATDRQVRTLNRQYRKKDRATDVLAFPTFAPKQAKVARRSVSAGGPGATVGKPPHVSGRRPPLGDIVIATGMARRQAREVGHSQQAEFRVLALHGLLHLLGYDHHTPRDQGRMTRMEARLRKKGGLRAGLIERTDVHTAFRRTRT